MKKSLLFIMLIAFCGLNEAHGQWATSGNNIYNTNSGFVGIGNNSPSTLLHVGKNMTEPAITVQNLGGIGGATYTMMDNTSGANWKFKVTGTGGFKIRDQANSLDVFVIEPNSIANAIYIKGTDNVGMGTASPHSSAALDITSTSKGFLPPRMTLAQLTAISSPAEGLLVFCTDCGTSGLGAMVIFLAGTWLQLSANSCLTPPPAPAEGVHLPSPFQIIWEWDAVVGATGYKWSVTNDYSTAEDMGTLTTKTESGLPPGTIHNRYAWAYNTCGNSTATILTATTTDWFCGDLISKNHIGGTVAPVNKTVIYGTVTNIPGENSKCWITSNLGADHQAYAVNDATEQSAGWYWQFNRQQGYKHDGSTRTPNTSWITSISENFDWLIANDPCALLLGNGWRLPTYSEWNNVDLNGGWNDWNGPWYSALKLHSAGLLERNNGSLSARGVYGAYWSGSKYSNGYGWYLYFSSGFCYMDSNYGEKAYGYSARCVKD
jgi:hypothetical protein